MKLLVIAQKVDTEDDVLGFFHGWVSHLAQEVDHLDVIALSVGSHDLPRNVTLHSLGKDRGSSKFIQALRFYWYVLSLLPRVDGVFVHMAPEYVRALYPVNIFFRKPIFMWYAHITVSPVAKWALSKVDKVFTPSKESFVFDTDKVVATGHGIDTEVFRPMPSERGSVPVVMTISRLSRVKRLNIFIEALSIVRQKYPQLHFQANIVGGPARREDHQYVKELKEQIQHLGLTQYITWTGPIKNFLTPNIYNASSVFVRLQCGGGFGKTELEAMACGTPIILCTDVYKVALKDFFQDLYFHEDDAEACADRIAKVLSWSDERRQAYANLAREIVVQNHNISHLAKRIVSEFRKTIERSK